MEKHVTHHQYSERALTLQHFRAGFFARCTSVLTTFFFCFVFYINPTGRAVADELSKEAQREAALDAAQEKTPEEALSHRLNKLREKLVITVPQEQQEAAANRSWLGEIKQSILPDNPLTDADLADVKVLQTNIDQAYQSAIGTLESEAQVIIEQSKNLSPDVQALIKQRHQAALNTVKTKYQTTQTQLNALVSATSASDQQKALDALQKTLEKSQFKSSSSPTDPNKMPWGAPAPETRTPVDSDKSLGAYLGIDPNANQVQLASLELAPGMLSAAAWDAARNLPLVADRSESVEVTFTPEIKTLAESLHNNAVEIYTWVHNNIRFIPSHGSIQGAQHTLETKQGNAMDTASLLIALLRAAKIPARYAYGTVQVPIDEVENWVGGAETPEAAMNLMSMGGIPITLIKMDGKPHSFRFEHVWVEAWVDYLPNRGTKDTKLGADLQEIKTKSGDTWIPMDASFKQYEYTQGMNLKDSVPFDAQALVNNFQTKATVNEAEGWVQNVPQADIEQQLTQFQNQLKTYIENQNPNATVGEVLGLQKITILPSRPLAAGLPYTRIVTSQTFSEVPDKLRHKFKYSLAQVTDGYVADPAFTIEEPTAKLAGKTLAVSFKPTTKADEDIIASRLPAPDANGQIDPNALPTSLPGYLINLTAQFTINGQVAAQANVGTMGGELNEELGLWSPKSNWEMAVNKPTAGEYRAIGLDLQGANPEQAARLKQKLETTKAKLESANETQLATLTKHDLVGDLLYGTVFNYFALNDLQDRIAAQTANIITYRLPSFGLFTTNLKTQYWYGIPRNVGFAGLSMDIDHFKYHHISKTNSDTERLSFSQSIGARMSAMEHLVPEQMFGTDGNQPKAISAVKALSIAASEGQKIWTIDSNNVDLALSQINLGADTETAIRNNINAGKVVTTHTNKINFNGWVGEGYISIDPMTGSGAYQIAGGSNGGELVVAGAFLAIMVSFLIGAVFATGIGGIILGGIFAIMGARSYASTINDLLTIHESEKISDEEFIGSIRLISILTMLASCIGIWGKLTKQSLAILDAMYIAVWNFIFKVAEIWPYK